MAKGQRRSNREPKKPKGNKKKPVLPPTILAPAPTKPKGVGR